jgi:hypothetical protein
VNIDDIIYYTINTHEIGMRDDDDDAKASDSTDILLAQIFGRSLSLGNVCHTLDSKQKDGEGKNQKVNASNSEPGNLKHGDTTYLLSRGEINTFNGQQYSSHGLLFVNGC